ncbi:MAG: hypothetical protein QG575_1906 [Euryarchaeota archaeon]|nr:hypothetical protein [Euryarchaeota archaeon]
MIRTQLDLAQMTIMEVWGSMIRNFCLMAILLLTLSASISLVTASDSSAMENNATTKEDISTVPAGAQGIWKADLGEKEIVMAVNQSAQSVFGLAKFEGDNPWNAALAGSLSANAVSFSLAAMEGEVLASTYISATLEGDTMNGFFIRSDSNGKASRGDFTATMISPDTSSYTPAAVTTAPLQTVQTEQVNTEQKNEAPPKEEPTAVLESASRFKDVTKLAKGINPNILPRMAPL